MEVERGDDRVVGGMLAIHADEVHASADAQFREGHVILTTQQKSNESSNTFYESSTILIFNNTTNFTALIVM